MNKVLIYLSLAIVLGLGIMLGTMNRMPGKSESHRILTDHGVIDTEGKYYLMYLPDNDVLTTEEFEALSILSAVYGSVQIVYPND